MRARFQRLLGVSMWIGALGLLWFSTWLWNEYGVPKGAWNCYAGAGIYCWFAKDSVPGPLTPYSLPFFVTVGFVLVVLIILGFALVGASLEDWP